MYRLRYSGCRIWSTCVHKYTASCRRTQCSKNERWYRSTILASQVIKITVSYLKCLNLFWCDFDRASTLICGNKMPTRYNRGFYCRSYCLLNMFQAPLCPSSGAQEYYTVVAACGFQVAGLVWSWGLCVRFAGCCRILQTRHITLSSTPDQQLENHSMKYHRQQPPYNTLELLMMGIVVPETCWASNKICNKNLCCI